MTKNLIGKIAAVPFVVGSNVVVGTAETAVVAVRGVLGAAMFGILAVGSVANQTLDTAIAGVQRTRTNTQKLFTEDTTKNKDE